MTQLGIVVALAAEARSLGVHRSCGSEIMPLSRRAFVCVSGIGAAAARLAGERLLAQGANALLSWGTAAALDSQLAPGQLLLPQAVLTTDGLAMPVCRQWQQQLYRKFSERIPVCVQPLIATDRVLTRPNDKRQLFNQSGAVAADMESAAVAGVALDAGVPYAAVRAIADSADTVIPQWVTRCIDSFGRIRIASALPSLLAHPADWYRLAALARDFRAAQTTLGVVAENKDCTDLIPDPPIACEEPRTIGSQK